MSPKSSLNAVVSAQLAEAPETPAKSSKKASILNFARAHPGHVNVAAIARATASRPSYVAAVLKEAELLPTYFDLYTATAPMNVYSEQFRGQVGYRDLATAKSSVKFMEQMYQEFAASGDRAGQHHVLVEALQLFDRARWSHKGAEARVFRSFLRQHLAPFNYVKLMQLAWRLTADLARALTSSEIASLIVRGSAGRFGRGSRN